MQEFSTPGRVTVMDARMILLVMTGAGVPMLTSGVVGVWIRSRTVGFASRSKLRLARTCGQNWVYVFN